MRKLLVVACLCVLLVNAPLVLAQECKNCSQASWGEQFSPGLGVCVANPAAGCIQSQGCNCWVGFYEGYGLSTKPDFFGGAFIRDAKGVVQGFRIDRPGPLARSRVVAGDVAWLVNGRKPNRKQFGTQKRPIRRAEATWGDDGRLSLRFYY